METVKRDWSRLDADALRQERADLLASIPPLQEVMHGSLIPRYTRCGKKTCHCATGQGHGPHWYLSALAANGRTRLDYVPAAFVDDVRRRIQNHHRLQEILSQVEEINRELLRHRERD